MDQTFSQQSNMNEDQNYVSQGYPAYASDDDGYGIVYQQPPLPGYGPVVHAGGQPRHFPDTEMQAMSYQQPLGMLPQQYGNATVYNPSSPHGRLPLSGSPPPQSPANLYDPLSPPISGSDTSEGFHHHSRNSSATGSPSSSRANSLVHRHPLRYNPTPSPTSSSGRRSRGRSLSEDDDSMGVGLAESLANTRKEATRRQRIEAEQRRRDELRDGYARLKDVLPISNQKSSKVSLLERATNHIITMEKNNRQLQARLEQLEAEIRRLRALNEKMALGGVAENSASPGHISVDNRPLSPPPEGQSGPGGSQDQGSDESSGSSKDGGY